MLEFVLKWEGLARAVTQEKVPWLWDQLTPGSISASLSSLNFSFFLSEIGCIMRTGGFTDGSLTHWTLSVSPP
jgi:hypothetical protein